MKKYTLLLLALLCILISCKRECFVGVEKNVDFFNNTADVIEGHLLSVDVMGPSEIAIDDTLLIFSTNDPTGYIKIYNIDNCKLIGKYGLKGRANNEFNMTLLASSNIAKTNKGSIVYIYDDLSLLKVMNIDSTIQHNIAIIDTAYRSISLIDGVTIFDFVNDVSFTYTKVHEDNVFLGRYNLPQYSYKAHNQNAEDIVVFSKLMNFEDVDDACYSYSGAVYKHPIRNIYYQPFQYMDYLLIFNMEDNTIRATHQNNSLSFNDKIPDNANSFCFGHSCNTNEYIMCLYFNGDYSKKSLKNEGEEKPELLIFDWSGNYLGGVKLGREIHRIAYDSRTQSLIGVNIDKESVYAFDLSGMIKSISVE